LDALANIDLKTRLVKEQKKRLNFIRIGTSGALQYDIPVDTPIISKMAIGFDGLLNFYANRNTITDASIEKAFIAHMSWNAQLTTPYFVEGSNELVEKVGFDMKKGLTISAPGFYGPQGRVLRLPIQDATINDKITAFEYQGLKITNYEMECSAIYGLSKLLNHNAVTVCNIIANRIRGEYSANYKKSVKELIIKVLERLI
jgi:uridine phosphorylase